MKLYYYTFYKNGEISEEVLKARKNKDDCVVSNGIYGGVEHCGNFKFYNNEEGKIKSYTSETAYMFSSRKVIIDDNLKRYALNRAEKYNYIVETSKAINIIFENEIETT